MGYIDRTYQKKKVIDPRIWFFIAFVILFLLIAWSNCKGQYFNVDYRTDACNDIEYAYITGYYPNNVYSLSLHLLYDPTMWSLISVGRSDVFINGFFLDTVYSDRWKCSWFSLHPLAYSDTLFRLNFLRKSYQGNGLLEWHVGTGENEITDFDGHALPCWFNNGGLVCLTTGIQEYQKEKVLKKYYKDGLIYIEVNGERYSLSGKQIK